MSLFTNPINQTLPTAGTTNRHTEETDVRNWLAYWQNYLTNFFSSANRLSGGTGFDSDNIADKAITGKHVSSNIKRASQPVADISFGFTIVKVLDLPLLVPVANADVTLNCAIMVEPFLTGNNLILLGIERSPDNLTWTRIATLEDTVFVNTVPLEFRWKRFAIANFVDVTPIIGINYYRAVIQHERNNTAIPANTGTASTVKLSDTSSSFLTAEWKNQRQP